MDKEVFEYWKEVRVDGTSITFEEGYIDKAGNDHFYRGAVYKFERGEDTKLAAQAANTLKINEFESIYGPAERYLGS